MPFSDNPFPASFTQGVSRDIAVSVAARKLVIQVWHFLNENIPTLLEAPEKRIRTNPPGASPDERGE